MSMPKWANDEWLYLLRAKVRVIKLKPSYQRNKRLQRISTRMKELSKLGKE